MQGFIINANRIKDEDLIVTILTPHGLERVYRFYGARHGHINIGYLIDFEIEYSPKTTIGRLKDVLHIGFSWILDRRKLHIWQNFVKLFYAHLFDTHELEPFYFDLLQEASQKFATQNPKRVCIESYVKLLEYEGRLHDEMECFLCGGKITDNPSLVRAFLPTHTSCTHTLTINKSALLELYKTKSSFFLSDKEVERLWAIVLEGL